jgi:hypothetical protein
MSKASKPAERSVYILGSHECKLTTGYLATPAGSDLDIYLTGFMGQTRLHGFVTGNGVVMCPRFKGGPLVLGQGHLYTPPPFKRVKTHPGCRFVSVVSIGGQMPDHIETGANGFMCTYSDTMLDEAVIKLILRKAIENA